MKVWPVALLVAGGLLWMASTAKAKGSSTGGRWIPPDDWPKSLDAARKRAEARSYSRAELRALTRDAALEAWLDPALLWAWLSAHQMGAPEGAPYQDRWGLRGLWGMSGPRFATEAAHARSMGLVGALGPSHVYQPEANARAAAASLVRMLTKWGGQDQPLGQMVADWIAGGYGKGAGWYADAVSAGYRNWSSPTQPPSLELGPESPIAK